MTAIDFPDNPTIGQVFDRWTWDGSKWVLAGTPVPSTAGDRLQYMLGEIAVSSFTRNGTAPTGSWRSICWSPELRLYCAVVDSGTDRVVTSPDGVTWTLRPCPAMGWQEVIWVADLGLFVAVAGTGTGNGRAMTSPDGINWTSRDFPAAYACYTVGWSSELGLLVVPAESGSGAIITSPNGIDWTLVSNTPAELFSHRWYQTVWAAELGIFCTVSSTGATNRVMTSPDGVNWTPRVSAVETSDWRGLAWSPKLGLFVATAATGTDRIATSPDGINWTSRPAPAANFPTNLYSCNWSPELELFHVPWSVGTAGILGRGYYSRDGINWRTIQPDQLGEGVLAACWSPEWGQFVGLYGGFVATSRLLGERV